MRVSRAQAEANREKVVDVASELFRAQGFGGIGVADLMKAAGLTHGGFYGNFGSKAELEAEAAQCAMDGTVAALAALTAGRDDPLAAIVRFYLSPAHRDNIAQGCAIAALSQEAVRSGPTVRAAFEAGVQHYLELLSRLMPEVTGEVRMKRAMATYSTMVGALLLARTVTDPAQSDAILQAAAEAVLGQAGALSPLER